MKRVSMTVTSMTALAVFVLWGASWGLSYVDLGAWSLSIALGIAAAKIALVVLFFMELVLESVSVHATLLAGIAMVAVLIAFMVADVETRGPPPLPPPPLHAAQ